MSTDLAPTAVGRAMTDVAYFAETIVRRPLWEHQLEVARSSARIRVIAAGRQVGKSVLVAVLCLWTAMRKPGALVLIVSAREDSAKRLLAEVLAMAMASPFVASSVVEGGIFVVRLSNGSEIRCVAASDAAIRGWPVDLLVVDEAGFVAQSVWEAAEPAIIARPGSQIILCSSPWGGKAHYFRALFDVGQAGTDPTVASWNWPSTVSPMVDQAYLESMRRRSAPAYYNREILALWGDADGTYFTESELMACVADYEMIDPATANNQLVVGGLDFGFANDSNTLACIGVLADGELAEVQPSPADATFFVAWVEEHKRMLYGDFVDRVIDVAKAPEFDDRGRQVSPGGFWLAALASETNGCGMAPTQALQKRAYTEGVQMNVRPVHTSSKRKENGFGTLRLLMAQGRMVLPRHPELLKQLAALTYETTEAGNVRISVPDNLGHDDLAMSLMQAVSCLNMRCDRRPDFATGSTGPKGGEVLRTERGTHIHTRPRCAGNVGAFVSPQGDDSDGWKSS